MAITVHLPLRQQVAKETAAQQDEAGKDENSFQVSQ